MDPITVILSALALGAEDVVRPLASQAIKDAYGGLRGLLVERFGKQDPALEVVLAKQAENPAIWKEPVGAELKTVGADQDQEVVNRATALLELLEKQQPGTTGGLVGEIKAQKVIVIGRDNSGAINM